MNKKQQIKQINKFDADIKNAIKYFPADKENAFICIRISEINKGLILSSTNEKNLSKMIDKLINIDENAKICVYNSVLEYLKKNPKDIPEFQKYLNKIKPFKLIKP